MSISFRVRQFGWLVCLSGMVICQPAIAAVIVSSNPGYSITWDGNDGRFNNQTIVPSNLSTAAGSGALGSSEMFPGGIHDIDNVRDGVYGNSNSWIAAPGDIDPRIGVTLGGVAPVNRIAWGRANNNSNFDRTDGTYTVEYTTDPSPSLGSTWTPIGSVTYNATVQAGFDPWQRHEYAIGQANGQPLNATSVRLRNSNNGIAIDEIELYHDDVRVAAAAPQAWLRSDQGVMSNAGNVVNWSDRSGNANDATPGIAPTVGGTLSGKPVVNFTAGQHLNLPQTSTLGLTNSDYEIFVVARSSDSGVQFLTAGGNGAGVGHFELHLNGVSGARFIPNGGPAEIGYADIGKVGNFTNGQAHLFNIRVEGGQGFVTVDGAQSADIVASAQSAVNQFLTLGIRGNVSLPLQGDMGEVLIFDRALSASERTQVERYVMQRWDTVREVEFGGTMDASTNIALASNGGTAFAKDVINNGGYGAHQIDHINNGLYGNSESWIGNTLQSHLGVAFAQETFIDRIAFGRDNGGEAQEFTDRINGTYTLQYTTVANPDASTPDIDWITIADLIYSSNLGDLSYPNAPWLRHEWEFNPVSATGVRLLVNSVDASGAIAIDELEVYAFVPVPEPSTYALLALGSVGLFFARRRRAARG